MKRHKTVDAHSARISSKHGQVKKINPASSNGRMMRKIGKAFIPHVILSLVRQKLLGQDHLNNPREIYRIILKHRRKAVKKIELHLDIQTQFVQQAIINWKAGNKESAIVLYAVAVEQTINQAYAVMLRSDGLDDTDIEQIIRGINIEPKLSWLLKYVAKKQLPRSFAKRLKTVIELRNAIVHLKAIPYKLDREDDSYSKIRLGIEKLRRFSISRNFVHLESLLSNIVVAKDPDLALAFDLTESLTVYDEKVLKQFES